VRVSSLQTERADRGFVISATLIFVLALLVTAWDFVQIQEMIYHFGIVPAVGLILFLTGRCHTRGGEENIGKILFIWSKSTANPPTRQTWDL